LRYFLSAAAIQLTLYLACSKFASCGLVMQLQDAYNALPHEHHMAALITTKSRRRSSSQKWPTDLLLLQLPMLGELNKDMAAAT
jgi:hypothetical protein